MRLTLFTSARSNRPIRIERTWAEFAATFKHDFRPPGTKLECPAFSPAIYGPDGRRCNDDVEAFGCFAADLDHLSDEDVERFLDAAHAKGWAFVLYTTWRHDEDPNRLRAVFPLSREVTPEEWPTLWARLYVVLGSVADPKCGDLARLYFGAYAPEGTEESAFHHVTEGPPIDVDATLQTTPPETPEGGASEATPGGAKTLISRERLDRLAKLLIRKRDDHHQELGHILAKVIAGTPFAPPHERDTTIFRLASVIAERFPDGDPDTIAEHFEQSLSHMLDPDTITPDQVSYKIARAQDALAQERTQADLEATHTKRQAIRDAFGDGRETPYTEEELEQIPEHRWVIQRGRAYYTRILNAYEGPYTNDDALSAIIRDLSPTPLELYTISPQGVRTPRALGALVRSYGFVAKDIAVDLSAPRARFDEPSRTLIEAPCPLRQITPREHPEISRWLEALAKDRLPLLLSWIAALTQLTKPCTALFLTGHKHTGKSLLPEGLSRLWTLLGYPTPLEDVLGTSFNDAQLKCPLVFADERLPTDHRGQALTSELRHYIQSRRRPLRRKFLPNADMIGAVRLVISANDSQILSTDEDLSNQDIGAIVDRYLHVPCHVEAYHLLRDTNTSNWVNGDKIAEHALWLRDHHVWKPNGRFLVHGDDRALHSRLISSTGIRSALLQFCVAYLLRPSLLDNDAKSQGFVRVSDRDLCINVQGVIAGWGHYVENEKCPTTGRLGRAITALSVEGKRPRFPVPGIGRPNFRVIATEHLIAWADDKDFATREEIETALSENTETRCKRLALN